MRPIRAMAASPATRAHQGKGGGRISAPLVVMVAPAGGVAGANVPIGIPGPAAGGKAPGGACIPGAGGGAGWIGAA